MGLPSRAGGGDRGDYRLQQSQSRRHCRLPPLQTGLHRQSMPPNMLELFEELCRVSRAAVIEVDRHVSLCDGLTETLSRPRLERSWRLCCGQMQREDIRKLASSVRQLCLDHERSAELLLGAAAALSQAHLQQLLAALALVGEDLLSDFLRADVYSSKYAEPARHGSRLKKLLPEPLAAQHQDATASPHPDVVRSHPLGSARPRPRHVAAAALDPWHDSVDVLGEAIIIPHIFRTKVIRAPSRERRRRHGNSWLPHLLNGSAIHSLSDAAVRAHALQQHGPHSPQQQAHGGLGMRRQRPSLEQRALLHTINGGCFSREIDAARRSQQHHSEDCAEQAPHELERYSELLAALPLSRAAKTITTTAGAQGSGLGCSSVPEQDNEAAACTQEPAHCNLSSQYTKYKSDILDGQTACSNWPTVLSDASCETGVTEQGMNLKAHLLSPRWFDSCLYLSTVYATDTVCEGGMMPWQQAH